MRKEIINPTNEINENDIPCTDEFTQEPGTEERLPFTLDEPTQTKTLPIPRTLRCDEIECRVGSITEKGLFLLLYKNARTDITILDETYGAGNWQRTHREEGGHVICSLSVRDPHDPTKWITKEDVGTESNTDPVKGAYSDSMKRAGVSWQIGIELYTTPKIWISSDKYHTTSKNGRPSTYDTFCVTRIGYDENRRINDLQIFNLDTYQVVYDRHK